MRAGAAMLTAMVLSSALLCGCGGGAAGGSAPARTATAPAVTSAPAQNGARVVTLASATAGATIYHTVDGSTPTASSQRYQAPFLVAANLTVKAIATAAGMNASSVASQSFAANIPSGTLVWSDEFSNTTSANAQPNPLVWTYDTGNSGFGNQELENYCAWGSSAAPCSAASPSAYVGTDGYLHIVAQQPSAGVYTSAQLKTRGFSASSTGASSSAPRCRRRRVSGQRHGCWATTSAPWIGQPAARWMCWSGSTRPRRRIGTRGRCTEQALPARRGWARFTTFPADKSRRDGTPMA